MTRAEAARMMREHQDETHHFCSEGRCGRERCKAYNMAVEALEAGPPSKICTHMVDLREKFCRDCWGGDPDRGGGG